MDEQIKLLSRQNSLVGQLHDCPTINEQKNDNNSCNNSRHFDHSHYSSWILLGQIVVAAMVMCSAMLIIYLQQPRTSSIVQSPISAVEQSTERSCARTCKIELAESIPQNLTFDGNVLALSTFEAWLKLIRGAKYSLSIAAYKSSLRGKHVFGSTVQEFSSQGEAIYEALLDASLQRGVAIRMVENSPSKDKGDNEDGLSLQKLGALTRRTLNLQKLFGSGTMHSKFIVADGKDFYLGSANLDWRSLNQKMEMGVFVKDCPCLAQDLSSIFEVYWRSAEAKNVSEIQEIVRKQPPVRFNNAQPLRLISEGVHTDLYLATSPRYMNNQGRSWDLDSIVNALDTAKGFAYIHVMDYFPMFLYSQNKRYWPRIDNAVRAAIMRGVHVKIIAAALHYPSVGLRFLKSLESMSGASGTVAVRIFKVPSSENVQTVMRRDRRTHKKFLVTDDSLIVGTSNWSGDYFEDRGTGAAIVIKGNSTSSSLITKMKKIFERDWNSAYTHPVGEYLERCIVVQGLQFEHSGNYTGSIPDFCEAEKDVSLLANKPRS